MREPPKDTRAWWFDPLSWILFAAPQVYLEMLKKVWVDHQVNYQYWRKFIKELQDDWTASITPVCRVACFLVVYAAGIDHVFPAVNRRLDSECWILSHPERRPER